jgi:hypothetical protein
LYVQVHPAHTMMRGDGSYNPRNVCIAARPDGGEVLTGTFIDDGRVDGAPRRPNRQFRIMIPPDFEAWQALNTEIFHGLQRIGTNVEINFIERPQKDCWLKCPTCSAVVQVQLLHVPHTRAIEGRGAATCSCGRVFSDSEVDNLAFWQ